jgi:hypothetical protein
VKAKPLQHLLVLLVSWVGKHLAQMCRRKWRTSHRRRREVRTSRTICVRPAKRSPRASGDVVGQTLERAKQHGVASREAIPGVSAGSAAKITEGSTCAVARWLEGDRRAGDSESAQQAWRFYGELAATREASLNEVIMHCLFWRDAVAEVLQESATELHVSLEALSRALQMLQIGTDYGFLRTSKAFDSAQMSTLRSPAPTTV